MANPDFSQESVTDQSSTGAITVSMPPTWSAGQIFILFIATDGFTPTLSTPNGFVIAQDPAGNTASVNAGLGICGMHIFWKRAVGSTTTTDPAPVIAAPSGGGTVQCCHINTYTNCRTVGTPFHKITTATVGTATTTINPPSITTTLNGCTIISCAASENDDSAFNTWVSTGAAAPTGQIDNGWHSGALGNACAFAGGRGGFATAGGPHNCTSTFGTSTRQAQFTFALASLPETFGNEAGQLGGSTPSSAGTILVSATEARQLGGSIPSITGTVQTPTNGAVAGLLSGSIPNISGTVVTGGVGQVSGTGGGSLGSATGTVAVSAIETSTSGSSTPATTGTIAVAGAASSGSSGSIPGIAATSNPPLAIGASAIRQKANGSVPGFPASGPLTTLTVDPAWTPSTAYTIIAGTRVTNVGNVYECKQNGTSASSGGPTGTGTSITDGTCQWNYVGPGTGACNTQPSGSLILLSGARGQWATPGTPARDNMGNTFTQLDLQSYAPPFAASIQALYGCFNAVGGVGHTATLDYGNPGGQPDECTITLVEVIGGKLIKAISYVEHTTPTANTVTSNPVTTSAEAIIIAYAWLDGVVRTAGQSHLAIFDSNFTPIPNATSLLVLDSAGYIQLAVAVFHAVNPGTYTAQITTNNNEGSAMRLVAVQAVDGSVGTEAGQLSGSIPSITGTVTTPDNGVVSGQLSGSIPSTSGTVSISASVAGQSSGSSPSSAGAILVTASESSQLSGSIPSISGSAQASATEAGQLSGSTPAISGNIAISGTESGQLDGSIPSIAGAIGISLVLSGQLSGSVPSITAETGGTIIIDGQLGGSTPSIAGTVAESAIVVGQLGGSIPATSGAVQISATSDITLDPISTSTTTTIDIVANSNNTLDTIVLSSDFILDGGILASAAILLDNASLTSTTTVDVVGNSSITLDNITVSSSATNDVTGDITGIVTSTGSATETIAVSATAALVLDSVTFSSTATVSTSSGNINASADIVLNNITTVAHTHIGKKAQLKVTRFIARSFDLDFIDLFWEIESFSRASDIITAYEFSLYRSESPEGPFDRISNPLEDRFHFRDFSPNLLHKWRQLYYKLKIVHKPSQTEFDGGVATLEAEPDLIALEITRQEDILLRNFTGRRCFLFPVRTFGEKCTCFDPSLGRETKSNCLTCFGTGFLGGYLRPIDFYMQFDPDSKNSSPTALSGDTHPRNTSGRLISYPPIKPKDLIVEAENKRWKVVTQTQTERLRAVVHQELSLHAVVRGDIEYKLPINLSELNKQSWADERNFINPQHVDDEDFDLSVYDDKPRGAIR